MKQALTYAVAISMLDACRSEVLTAFRAAGGNCDRWQASDRAAMAEAMSRAEDRLEFRQGHLLAAERAAIRTMRRRLENSLEEAKRRAA